VARGHAELIRETTRDGQTIRDVDVILDEMGRLSKLSDRLLMLAGADHPGFLVFDDVAVAPLVDETISRWGPTARRVWSSRADAPGVVVADRERLKAALDALIERRERDGRRRADLVIGERPRRDPHPGGVGRR
jgi:hypothetical protein